MIGAALNLYFCWLWMMKFGIPPDVTLAWLTATGTEVELWMARKWGFPVK